MAWEGDKVKAAVVEASQFAIDEIIAACVIAAKSSHPGWINRSGTAEGSIRMVEPAHEDGNGVAGLWGSVDVDYMIWLELNHGSALRSAADALYPELPSRIQKALGR